MQSNDFLFQVPIRYRGTPAGSLHIYKLASRGPMPFCDCFTVTQYIGAHMSTLQRGKPHPSTTMCAAVLLCGVAASLAHGAAPMSVLEHWILGRAGGWDYLTVDSTGRRLFVSRGTHVHVVDTGPGKLVGSIADTNGVHDIALPEELHRGFISNGRADAVTDFDLDTLKTLKEAPVPGHNPDAILCGLLLFMSFYPELASREQLAFSLRAQCVTTFW